MILIILFTNQILTDMLSKLLPFFTILLVLTTAQDDFAYQHTLECTTIGAKGCLNWNKTTIISENMSTYSGFSANSSVLTRKGPRTMAHLQLGEELLGVDPNTGHHGYSQVTTWMYYNPFAKSEFINIKTNQGASFSSSAL